MGGPYGIGHAACLAAQLPGDSRTVFAYVQAGETGRAQGESKPIDEYMEILSRPRKEVQHGG